jgi:hypothetical protein
MLLLSARQIHQFPAIMSFGSPGFSLIAATTAGLRRFKATTVEIGT